MKKLHLAEENDDREGNKIGKVTLMWASII